MSPRSIPDLQPNELVLFMSAKDGRLDFHAQLPKKEGTNPVYTQEEYVLQCLAVGLMGILGQSSKDVIKSGHDILTAQREQATLNVADPDPEAVKGFDAVVEAVANGQ